MDSPGTARVAPVRSGIGTARGRRTPPFRRHQSRWAPHRDPGTQISRQPIAAGDFVLAFIPSVTWDPARYPWPEVLDITRDKHDHFVFGHGFHQCPGRQLVRLEMWVMLETVLRRIPGLRLAIEPEDIRYREHSAVPGPVTVPLTWDSILPHTTTS